MEWRVEVEIKIIHPLIFDVFLKTKVWTPYFTHQQSTNEISLSKLAF